MDKTIVILDLHGIIYSHSTDFDIEKSSAKIKEEIVKNQLSQKDGLDAEWELIKWGALPIYFFPKAIARAKEIFRKDNKIAICSNSRTEEQKLIIKRFFEQCKIDYPFWEIDFHDFSKYGSKKNYEDWLKIFRQYPRVDIIYEDNSDYFGATKEAIEIGGFKNTIFKISL